MLPEYFLNKFIFDTAFIATVTSASLLVYSLLLYPKLLRLFTKLVKKPQIPSDPETWPYISLLIAVHNGEKLIEHKLSNSRSIDYPKDKLEIVVTTDGCNDTTADIVRSMNCKNVKLVENMAHLGKNNALSTGIRECHGEIVVVSDADAILEPDAVKKLIRWFSYEWVGGVRGSKVMDDGYNEFNRPLSKYNIFQHRQNELESILHSTGTNEGKLHAIRHGLFTPLLSSGGCDDSLNLYNVVRSGYRFLIDTSAIALIPVPVNDPAHEIQRRRRMIKRTFLAMWAYSDLFNPFKFGWFAWTMWSFKLFRRLIPVFFLIMTTSLLILSLSNLLYSIPFLLVILFPIIALLTHVHILTIPIKRSRWSSLHASVYYFMLGVWGTFRGFIDFLFGTGFKGTWKVIKTPKKNAHDTKNKTIAV